MPWNGQNIAWTRAAIIAGVPHASGVYAIWKPDTWIYVGETNDLQRRLLEHYDGDNACITRQNPTACGYEIVAAASRVARQNILIRELRPVCNQMLG